MKLKRIFLPITINGLTIKNRLVMPAIHHLYTPDGCATERFNQYYWRRAEGGVGMIIVGGCRFDDYGGSTAMMSLQKDEFIPGWKEFTDGVHERGAKVAVQLYHAGRYARQKNVPEGKEALAPSSVYANYTKETAKAMTISELKEIVKNWADGAARAKKAGFDAVEIVASAGYLICQFLSPLTNLRDDEYGGSWENRCRFPIEVITAVRAAVGKDYPVFMRIAGNDFVEGSNTNTEAVEFAKLIEKAGVDMINVTGGWHETNIPQIPGDVPPAGYSYLAATIKAAVSVPVMVSNRINDPVVAEEVLALGRGDLIAVGRALIADPDWCNKAKEDRFDEIRRCVACGQGCLAKTFFAKPIECLVNGYAGREYLFKDKKFSVHKTLLVIGGGPSGCEFAIKAAELGHDVTLWEMNNRIGGQLQLVAAPPSKMEFANLIKYYETMLKKLEVKLELNKEVTEESFTENDFDAVIVATGASPKIITLPGCSKEITVYNAWEILSGDVMAGKHVVIVGGGSVGCETAQYLAHKGSLSAEQLYFLASQKAETPERIDELLNSSDRHVAIVEIMKSIGEGFDLGTGWPIMKDLKRLGVKQYTLSKILDVNDDKVIIEKTNKDGTTETIAIPCDTIVLAVGSKSNNTLYEKLKGKISQLYNIGDSNQVGKVLDAIRDADSLATEM